MSQLTLIPPAIHSYLPTQSGKDNIGIGYTKHGERYLLKSDPAVCIAEYIGASLCIACGIPAPQPAVVEFKRRRIFGSRLETGVELPAIQDDVVKLVAKCQNKTIFSAVLALDLAIGNNDRHWHNWLPQPQADGSVLMRAVDFSRAWPTSHPPTPLLSMKGENTEKVWRQWKSLGIGYDEVSALAVCDLLGAVSPSWVNDLFSSLPVEWMVSASGPELIAWWSSDWNNRVKSVRDFLQQGAWS